MSSPIVVGDALASVTIEIRRQAHPLQPWFEASGTFRVEGAEVRFTTLVEAGTIQHFGEALEGLHKTLKGEALFATGSMRRMSSCT